MKKFFGFVKLILMCLGVLYISQYVHFISFDDWWGGTSLPIISTPLNPEGTEAEEIIKAAQRYWLDKHYEQANTAKYADYMTLAEKETIYYLNLARMNPPLFAETFVKPYKGDKYGNYLIGSSYKASLLEEMKNLRPRAPLKPNRAMWELAKCHAINGSKLGITGHDRKLSQCPEGYAGECCDYGEKGGLEIILSLLIDHDVPSLGHRKICFSPELKSVGVSIQPHKSRYIQNAVLDFAR